MENSQLSTLNSQLIKGLLLDFGGTIDTNGIHWAEAFWSAYADAGVPVAKAAFREAYKHGERTLALHPVIKPEHGFRDVLNAKTDIQLQYLVETGHLPVSFDIPAAGGHIVRFCCGLVCQTVAKTAPVLEALSQAYPLVLVSNYYGNIRTVLKDLGIGQYFNHIVESATAGVRKPDPAIFALGADALGFDAANVAVVGDSYTKDIIPGKETGCQTVWLKGQEWEETPDTGKADVVIGSFEDLKEIFLKNSKKM